MKTAKQLGLTKTQHKNLAKLTIFVRDSIPPPKFNIRSFHSEENEYPADATYNECSTSACFCGYGPLAGIKPRKAEDWNDYAGRVFGAKLECFEDHAIFELLFDGTHKNSKVAAIKRGAYFLMNGLPKTNLYLGHWEAPRSFSPNWPEIEKIANS